VLGKQSGAAHCGRNVVFRVKAVMRELRLVMNRMMFYSQRSSPALACLACHSIRRSHRRGGEQ